MKVTKEITEKIQVYIRFENFDHNFNLLRTSTFFRSITPGVTSTRKDGVDHVYHARVTKFQVQKASYNILSLM